LYYLAERSVILLESWYSFAVRAKSGIGACRSEATSSMDQGWIHGFACSMKIFFLWEMLDEDLIDPHIISQIFFLEFVLFSHEPGRKKVGCSYCPLITSGEA
jgi:hypothetical protein